MIINEIKNIRSEDSDILKFSYIISFILCGVAGYLFYNGVKGSNSILIIAFVLFFLGRMAPATIRPVYMLWMLLATLLGWVMTRLILSLLFYVIIFPIGLLLKIYGRTTNKKSDKSYWNVIEKKLDNKNHLEKQY
tara:strand:- start:1065 stop:1469 length:405 start_codon:yes stop_codon:yes gene_type:complete